MYSVFLSFDFIFFFFFIYPFFFFFFFFQAEDGIRDKLVTGVQTCVFRSPENDTFEYRFDPTRPESRAARLIVDDVLQRGKGRADVVKVGEEKVTEPGARYVDFLVPRSEERRVGKECRYWWSTYDEKKICM